MLLFCLVESSLQAQAELAERTAFKAMLNEEEQKSVFEEHMTNLCARKDRKAERKEKKKRKRSHSDEHDYEEGQYRERSRSRRREERSHREVSVRLVDGKWLLEVTSEHGEKTNSWSHVLEEY